MSTDLITSWFPMTSLTRPTVLGSLSWTCIPDKHRWIINHHATDIGAGWVTQTDVARDYLDYKYGHWKGRVTTGQYNEVVARKRSSPLVAIPGQYDNAVYVDLDSAYWTILKIVGWDVDYYPLRFVNVRSDNRDFPTPELKLARNSLVTMGLPGSMKMWTGEKLIVKKTGSRYINLVLWALVQDVLNAFAVDMLRIGAIYAHTDGYIIPEAQLDDAWSLAGAWGLSLSVRHHGDATVYGPGAYSIGGHICKHRPREPKPLMKVYNPGCSWLRRKISFHSRRRKVCE
jgi:hypothetical protein